MPQLMDFHFAPTGDGSPTLEFHYDSGIIEKMHHGKGAFSETIYIYKQALSGPRILSIGLGLAYNEIMSACYAIQQGLEDKIFLLSFEKEHFLIEQILGFIQQSTTHDLPFSSTYLRQDFFVAYEDICSRMSAHFEVEPMQVKNVLAKWVLNNRWQIHGEFNVEKAHEHTPFNSIFYDAFSNKMSPEFWSEEFLTRFLDLWAAPDCMLATYAAKGSLTRALKANGFKVEKRQGFGGKKESTLAERSSF